MSDDLVKRLRATTDGATVNPDGPEAAARIAALEAAVTQCRTLSAMLKPQADRIAELEAALQDAARVLHKAGEQFSEYAKKTCRVSNGCRRPEGSGKSTMGAAVL